MTTLNDQEHKFLELMRRGGDNNAKQLVFMIDRLCSTIAQQAAELARLNQGYQPEPPKRELSLAEIYWLNQVSKMEVDNQPLRNGEFSEVNWPHINALLVQRYIRAEMEDGFTAYFMTDAGREKWSALRTPAPAPSAPTATTLHERCSTCNGKGTLLCENCDGEGYMRNDWGDLKECPRCDGTGNRECKSCKGAGAVEYTLPQPAKPAPVAPAAASDLTPAQVKLLKSLADGGHILYLTLTQMYHLYPRHGKNGQIEAQRVYELRDAGYIQTQGFTYVITNEGRAALKASEL